MSLGETLYTRSFESLEDAPSEDFMSLVRVKTEQAITLEGVESRIKDGEKLNVKFGTDPTGPELHLGHIVPIRVLDLFSRANHHIDLIFGDFTAKVGDPTGRNEGRPVLTDEKIAANMLTFRDQVDKYFDTNRPNVDVHTNSTWLGRLSLADVFGYLQAINLTEATQRNDFRERMKAGQAVSLAETIYGTLMGIDSVELKTDIELGGVDQLLNFQQTRTVQRSSGQKAEDVIMTPIIEGTSGDGRKMSKSLGNYVPVVADASEVFGKLMSIPDSLIMTYIKAFAPVYVSDIPELERLVREEPMLLKKELATYMAGMSSSDYSVGEQVREDFERRFSSKEINQSDAKPLEIINDNLAETLLNTGDFRSLSELRRLAAQGGIKVDGTKLDIDSLNGSLKPGAIITVGKRKIYFVR
jgi:tyrosyl-tRNA synthetase